MSLSKEDILNSIAKMNVLEIVELTKLMEEKFNISLSNIQQVNQNKNDSEVKEEEEIKKTFSVVINNYGKSKINIIKIVRELTNLGLKEAKDFIESLPKALKEDLPKDEAEEIKEKLEKAGALVELK